MVVRKTFLFLLRRPEALVSARLPLLELTARKSGRANRANGSSVKTSPASFIPISMAGGRRAALAITAVALVAGVLVALSQDEAVPAAASSPAVFQRLAEASSSDGSRLRLASLPKFSPAALALQHNQVEAASIVVSKKQELTAGKATNSSTVAAAGAKAALGAKKLAAKAKSAGADALGFLVGTAQHSVH